MQTVITGGAIVTILGVGLLVYSGRMALKIRSAGLDDGATRAALTKVLYWNMGGLGVAMLGLMTVVVGLILN